MLYYNNNKYISAINVQNDKSMTAISLFTDSLNALVKKI